MKTLYNYYVQLTPFDFLKTVFNDNFFSTEKDFINMFLSSFSIAVPSTWNYLFTCSKIQNDIRTKYLEYLNNLKYVKIDWIDDYSIICALIRYDYNLLKYISKQNIALKLLMKTVDNCHRFSYFNDAIKWDKKFLLDVAYVNGITYQYFKQEYKDDREILLMAVSCNPYAIRYAPKVFLNDKEIAYAAVKTATFAPYDVMKYFDQSLWDEKEFVIQLLKDGFIDIYRGLSSNLQADPDIKMLCKK